MGILSYKSSIPSQDGEYKKNVVELNVFWAVQMDIERYNYVDIILRKLKMGKLHEEITERENSKVVVKRSMKEQALAELVTGDQPADEVGGQNDDDDEMRKVEGIFPTGLGPDGALLKRNNSDF